MFQPMVQINLPNSNFDGLILTSNNLKQLMVNKIGFVDI
jgi:hypothetical protein